MEIEAKFAITTPFPPERLNKLPIAPFTLRPAGVERHVDTLLDTPSRAVTNAMHGLRIREVGERHVLTLKGPNRGVGALHEREELEAEISGTPANDPRAWPPAIAARALALAGDEPLLPLFHIRVERRLWLARRSGRVIAEVALDVGEILACGRRESIYELEVELKGAGAREDLDALCAALQASLPLIAESRSKLERGLALVRHAQWTLDGATPLERVGRHTVHKHLRALLKAQRDVRERGDPDAIHDMRVAMRRIRTTLQAFEGAGVFPEADLKSMHRRLGKEASLLGKVRDADIFLGRIRAWVAQEDQRVDDLAPLRDLLAERRAQGYERLVKWLSRKKHARLLVDIQVFAQTPFAYQDGCALTRHYAGSVIWARYEAVLRFEALLLDADPPTLHQVRIACKRLRYALELFAPQLGAGISPLRKALVAAQNELGEIQDVTVALNFVTHQRESAHVSAGMDAFAQSLQDERAERMRRIRAVWEPLSAQPARVALSKALAAL